MRFAAVPLVAALLFAAGPGGRAALAQSYPDRPIKIVAPTTPGSPADVLARLVGESMSSVLGVPIAVENRAGADQIIGLEHVAKGAPADGYTLILVGLDGQALLPLTKKSLRFDPMRDLVLVAGVGEARYVLAGPSSLPHITFESLVSAVRAAPGRFNYGASGPTVRIPTVMLMKALGLQMEYVAYKGGGPYSIDLAAGNIHWGFLSETTAQTVRDRVRLYAVTGQGRSPANPDVPTFAELGFPQMQGPAYGLAVRAETPKPIMDRLVEAAGKALQSTPLRARAQVAYLTIRHEPPQAAREALDRRFANYQAVAAAIGLQPE
jgi:tripartite-type tricarboxylate transporter receptor subunit TctC